MIDPDIAALRAEIDAIDDQLIALLNARSQVVKRVGMTKKARQQTGRSFIRAGREASMVRRMHEVFSAGVFPAHAAAHLWRIIISASLSLENPMTISACATDKNADIFWLAREYFGWFTPVTRQPGPRRVVAEVSEGRAEVGVLPLPGNGEGDEEWWLKLPDDVKIFACAPFIIANAGKVQALLIAKTEPEDTGHDVTLLTIETRSDVSQSRLKTLFDKYGRTASWLAAESFPSGHRAHFVEIDGFHPPAAEIFHLLRQEIGASLIALRPVGGYALPILYQEQNAA